MGAYTVSIGNGYYMKLIIALIAFVTGIFLWKKKKGKTQIVIPFTILAAMFLIRYVWDGLKIILMVRETAASSISIIGGADGPTSVFLAGKVSGPTDWQFAVGGVIIAVLLWWLIRKKSGKE